MMSLPFKQLSKIFGFYVRVIGRTLGSHKNCSYICLFLPRPDAEPSFIHLSKTLASRVRMIEKTLGSYPMFIFLYLSKCNDESHFS